MKHKNFAERLRVAMEVRHTDAFSIVPALEIQHNTFSHWKNGLALPSELNMTRLAKALDVSIDWLQMDQPVQIPHCEF